VPIYLHFLDRELSSSVGFSLAPREATSIVAPLLLCTDSQLYCGLSLLFENDRVLPGERFFFETLLAAGDLDCVSNHPKIGEFIEARRVLYQHDAARYPLYFSEEGVGQPLLKPTFMKTHDTTAKLVGDLTTWSIAPGAVQGYLTNEELCDPAVATVRLALNRREGRAVTYALFSPYVEQQVGRLRLEGYIRRLISIHYTEDYLAVMDGDIATGIRGLQFFDNLGRYFPFYDIPVLRILSSPWQVDAFIRSLDQRSLVALANIRHSDEHRLLAAEIRWLLQALHARFSAPGVN
jgi:hypothetical protein